MADIQTPDRVAPEVVAIAPERPARRRRPGRLSFSWGAYLGLAPLAIMLGVFCYYPAASGIFHSFWNWNPGQESSFIGFDNYATMLSDQLWWESFKNLGIIFLFGVVSWVIPIASC